MSGRYASPISEIERIETAIVSLLAAQCPVNCRVEACPDVPEEFDLAGAPSAVLVHYAASRHVGARIRLAGPMGFAVIVVARCADIDGGGVMTLRGPAGAYVLLETVEQTLAGGRVPGAEEIAVLRTQLESQAGGVWRWIVEAETGATRGAPAGESPGIPFIPKTL